jgi:hypothetical protein
MHAAAAQPQLKVVRTLCSFLDFWDRKLLEDLSVRRCNPRRIRKLTDRLMAAELMMLDLSLVARSKASSFGFGFAVLHFLWRVIAVSAAAKGTNAWTPAGLLS